MRLSISCPSCQYCNVLIRGIRTDERNARRIYFSQYFHHLPPASSCRILRQFPSYNCDLNNKTAKLMQISHNAQKSVSKQPLTATSGPLRPARLPRRCRMPKIVGKPARTASACLQLSRRSTPVLSRTKARPFHHRGRSDPVTRRAMPGTRGVRWGFSVTGMRCAPQHWRASWPGSGQSLV
jgi:hypothetical protein